MDAAVAYWRSLRSDDESVFATTLDLDVSTLPQITWGTTGDVISIDGRSRPRGHTAERRSAFDAALVYMGLTAGQRIEDTPVDVVFIGSCTNSRLSICRAAAAIDGRHAAPGVRALVVPVQWFAAATEGLDMVFRDAGFDGEAAARCLGMNDDVNRPARAACRRPIATLRADKCAGRRIWRAR
jgi:homoaconitase/3-isopropylmalate dehydratase large subunit